MKKTRWVLGVGYPDLIDTIGYGFDAIGISELPYDVFKNLDINFPKSALTGKDRYRLVLELVETKEKT